MKKIIRLILAFILLLISTSVIAQHIERVSIDQNNDDPNDHSINPVVSSDGRFVAFESYASDLVPNDNNGWPDIFVFDRVLQKTERVSVSSSGVEANQQSQRPSISNDGRYVAFYSVADNLIDGTVLTNPNQIYVRDRMLQKTLIGSIASNGNPSGGASIGKISGNGQYLMFLPGNLDFEGLNLTSVNVFVHNFQSGLTELVSIPYSGFEADDSSYPTDISSDGRYVLMSSYATNLIARDRNGAADLFVRDRLLGTTEMVSFNTDGTQRTASTNGGKISEDGRYVVYACRETFHTLSLCIFDRSLQQTNIAVSNLIGSFSIDSSSRFITYTGQLVENNVNPKYDVFVKDLNTNFVQILSKNSFNEPGNNSSYHVDIAKDGKSVAFDSFASNLLGHNFEDINGKTDIFLVEVITPTATPTLTPTSTYTPTPTLTATATPTIVINQTVTAIQPTAIIKDVQIPIVQVKNTSGKAGKKISLSALVSDDSGITSELIIFWNKGKKITTISLPARNTTSNGYRTFVFNAKKQKKGNLKFCIVATDPTGNKSQEQCAALKLK